MRSADSRVSCASLPCADAAGLARTAVQLYSCTAVRLYRGVSLLPYTLVVV